MLQCHIFDPEKRRDNSPNFHPQCEKIDPYFLQHGSKTHKNSSNQAARFHCHSSSAIALGLRCTRGAAASGGRGRGGFGIRAAAASRRSDGSLSGGGMRSRGATSSLNNGATAGAIGRGGVTVGRLGLLCTKLVWVIGAVVVAAVNMRYHISPHGRDRMRMEVLFCRDER